MSNIALIEAKQSRTNFEQYFPFKFDKYELCSDPSISKVLKKDVDISFDPDSYDWIILVGSEALKYYTKVTQVMQYAGTLVDDKFLPTINPSMLSFKPEAKPLWEKSIENIIGYVEGTKKKAIIDDERFLGIEDTQQALDYIQKCIDAPEDFFGIDSETTGLYPRNGYILGISLSYGPETGCYINANYINDSVETKLQELFDKKRAVFHNAKFDIPMFEYHFNVKVDKFEDTMLMHYVIDENPGTHGLKQLAMRFTDYGDYEKPMYDWIEEYRKEHGILKDDFKWEWIPFDVMKNYASIDACATYILFSKFEKALKKGNQRLMSVYRDILLPGCRFLMKIQDNGVPFSKERLAQSQDLMAHEIHEAVHRLTTNEAVQRFQQEEKIDFNPNSVVQLRTLLFDYAKLPPTGIKTEKGADSTNSEVLEKLSLISEIPKLILDVRTKSKIKNTYLDKIIPALDGDSRLRTNFNLHGTTSGRLSSSGKLNMQQLPRDNPTVKGCIQANPGNKIVAMDLTTAEVYVAAVLSEDHELQAVFRSGGNFHSTIAHKVFRLDCDIEEVAEKYKTYRQAAKAVTFGIMYGAGPNKISDQVTKDGGKLSPVQAKKIIDEYFRTFWKLEEWIIQQQQFIKTNGFIYSYFGRKRRLPEAQSNNKGVAGHTVRSGLNFLVQSAASDINLIGAIEAQKEIEKRNLEAKIFALVHDSVLAEVPEGEIEEYQQLLKTCIQADRGLTIPGCPIGCDFEVGDDYSMGKYAARV
ncbi:MAG: DNA polymerase [Burkholderiaceae bacterium]